MRIEEITKGNLSEASDLVLKQLKYKFAKFWDRHFKNNDREIVGCFERSSFIGKYRLLLKELDSAHRGLQHSTCDIDRQAFKQTMEIKKAGLDISLLGKITTEENYISINEDFAKADKVKVTIRADEPDEVIKILMEANLTKSIKEMLNKSIDFEYNDKFEGDCIPLFHNVLLPVSKIEKVNVKRDYDEIEKDIVILPIEKGDEHIVYGIVYEPDTVDAQGDQASADEIQKAAYDFMENVQTFKVMHKGKKVKVKILENYIAPVDFTIAKKQVKKGSWVLVTRILDSKLWKDIKAGKLTGYSMAGYAKIE